jgi:hypothetical protein
MLIPSLETFSNRNRLEIIYPFDTKKSLQTTYRITRWKCTNIMLSLAVLSRDTGEDTMTGSRLKRVAPYLEGEEAFDFTYWFAVFGLLSPKLNGGPVKGDPITLWY